jgi:hypothetical protein
MSKQTGSTVSFVVEQTWKDVGSVKAIHVMYQDVDDRMQCSINIDVANETPVYTALCVDGVAEVAVFVTDDSFTGLTDISDRIPGSCTIPSLDVAMFMFSVPCDPNDEAFCAEETLCPEVSPSGSPTTLSEESANEMPNNSPNKAPSTAPSENPSESSEDDLSESPSTSPSESPSIAPSEFPSESPSTFPSESPSISPSKLASEFSDDDSSEAPSTEISEAPTDTPNTLPSETPSVSPILNTVRTIKDPICLQEAQLQGTSVEQDGPFMYSSMPIRIGSQTSTTVTFTIENAWTADDDGSLDFIHAVFVGTDKAMVCSQSAAVVDSTQDFTTLCVDGVADVVLFVTDASFQGADNVTDNIPSFCQSSDENTVMFTFRIPCDPADESFCNEKSLCPETEAPDTVATSLVSCQQEARLDSDSTNKDKNGMYTSTPIVIADQQSTKVSFKMKQSWSTPDGTLGAMSVYYESSSDERMICDEITNIHQESPLYTAKCVGEVAEIALFIRDDSFNELMDVSNTVPSICSDAQECPAGKLAVFFFTIPCNSSDESFCINSEVEGDGSFSMQMRDDKEGHIVITSNDISCGVIHNETFESPGDALSWEGGIESSIEAFGNFLGRFGSDNPEVHKVFRMPVEASSATIRFQLYVINGGSIEDTLQLGIQNSWVDINLTSEATHYHQDESITLRDRDSDRLSFISTAKGDGSTYNIELTIPNRWWLNHNNDCSFGFRVITNNDINEDGYGVDNFTVKVDCQTKRRTKGLVNDPQTEPSEAGDDGSTYCQSSDYPCAEGNDMVNVCHYSSRQGYQTFCIPEQDSEILRFYRNDYCGPCAYAFRKAIVE